MSGWMTPARLAALDEIRAACTNAGGPVARKTLSARTRAHLKWLRWVGLVDPVQPWTHCAVSVPGDVDELLDGLAREPGPPPRQPVVTERQRRALALWRSGRFGTFAELGKELGVTQQGARQLVQRAQRGTSA